jgi:serine/threonine protein kinase
VLDRAVGLEAAVAPCVFETDLRDGDAALLCSDGLSNLLDETALLSGLRSHHTARHFVYDARDKATPETLDDISAIVIQIEKTGKLAAVKSLPLAIPPNLRRGDQIDGYTLVKSFQQSDRVWLATRDNQRFTLKFAPQEAAQSDEILNAFVKESWNATRLQDGGFFPRSFVPERVTARYYVMDFIEASNLKALLRSRRLAVDEGVALGRFLLKAAQYLMRLDLVHGDIKPDNILVPGGYDSIDFKIVDFGSVTEVFSIASRAGTASYLAPERFQGAPISERTEVFAIGATLFEALTQSLPYGEIERFQTPAFHAPKRPGALNSNLPAWMESVLLRAVSVDPSRRYQNYSEFLFDLDHPDRVAPFHAPNTPLRERDPLRFYKAAFFTTLAVAITLLLLLLMLTR